MRYVITPAPGDQKCVKILQGFSSLDMGDGDFIVHFTEGQLGQFRRKFPDAQVEVAADPNWGGYREGAGRPPLAEDEPTARVTVTLPESLAKHAKATGNASKYIRHLIEADMH